MTTIDPQIVETLDRNQVDFLRTTTIAVVQSHQILRTTVAIRIEINLLDFLLINLVDFLKAVDHRKTLPSSSRDSVYIQLHKEFNKRLIQK